MKKAKKMSGGRTVARFLLGSKVVHEIVSDKSSVGGYSVKLGPGHYMEIPQHSLAEIIAYGLSRGFEVMEVA